MKKATPKILILSFLLFLGIFTPASQAFAGVGDTIVVQTITFDSLPWNAQYNGTFMFPDDTVSYEKVLMYYTLKCDQATTQDQYPCGEWDYLTYTFVWDSSGTMDSTYKSRSNFTVGGNNRDSLAYTSIPTWTSYHDWQYSITHSGVVSFDSAIVGTGTTSINHPFSTSETDGRGQYIWRASELTSAGLGAGNLSGLRVNVASAGSSIRNLTIRIKSTTQTVLDSDDDLENSGFTTVYHLNTAWVSTGWHDIQFITPFNWNGTDNLLIDFSFDNDAGGTDNLVLGSNPGYFCGLTASGTDYYLNFQDNGDYVNLGQGPQVTGANPRTIEAWAWADQFNGGGIFAAGQTGTAGKDFSLRTMSTDDLWRAQMWGTPDFDATLTGSKGSWHHYALVYDNGTTYMYYDGQLAGQKAYTLNTGDRDIWLGRWAGSWFKGKIDEVRCWDVALSAGTLQSWMNRSVNATHPNYANLLGYYPFNEGNGTNSADATSQQDDAYLNGIPDWIQKAGPDLSFDLSVTNTRPNVIFEQGVYTTSTLDSTLSVDSVQKSPVVLVEYNNPANGAQIPDDAPNHPSMPTDTSLVWEAGIYCYTYDKNTGAKVDSMLIPAQNTLYRNDLIWYSPIVRFEIERFITPYGINLDLGPQGFTWVYDVTDYAPLFHGPVRLQSGNRQELLDMRFVIIEGTPTREVKKVQNLYDGSFAYRGMADGDLLTPVDIPLDPTAAGYRIKTRTSGHGFGSGENCAEFCNKEHWIDVDGTPKVFAWDVWKECATNPVYPQGGTWIYDRAGWCPGSETDTYNWELTPHVTPGDTVTLDYGVEGYPANGGNGNYVTRVQMVTYGPINHTTDAAVERIVAPNNWDIYSKLNPICANPSVIISNRGSNDLTSATIHYGVVGGDSATFAWTGTLGFEEQEEVELDLLDWDQGGTDQFFAYVETSGDQYPTNDTLYSTFEAPRVFPNHFFMNFRTNGRAQETKYALYDDQGNLLHQSSPFWAANSIYKDTFLLNQGCYVFRLWDTDEDGLSFFANNDGTGFARFIEVGGPALINFNPDFGKEVWLQFRVDTQISLDETGLDPFIKVYPNPSNGPINVEYNFGQLREVEVEVLNNMGQSMYQADLGAVNWGRHPINLDQAPDGVYFVKIRSGEEELVKKIVLQN